LWLWQSNVFVDSHKIARKESEHLLLHLLLLKQLLPHGLLLLPHLLKHDHLGLLHTCLLGLEHVLPLV
jgi:hypothetical protein